VLAVSLPEKCLAIVAHRADALQEGNYTLAEGACPIQLI
jgi:hypothetical protein